MKRPGRLRDALIGIALTAGFIGFTPMAIAAGAGCPANLPNTNGAHPNPNPVPAPLSGVNDIVKFDPGSIIVPMDGCYQASSFLSFKEQTWVVQQLYNDPLATDKNKVCGKGDEMVMAYTALQRLVLAGIPVHWAIKSAKTGWNEADFSVTRAGGSPVKHMTKSGTITDPYSSLTSVRYGGGAFIVDAADAAAAMTLIKGMASGYDVIDFHIAQVGFDAPIFQTIGTLPKLAVVDVDDAATAFHQPQTGFLSSAIDDALMKDLEGILFDWVSTDDVLADNLTTKGYSLAWLPSFELNGAPTPRQLAIFAKLEAFADQGGSILAQDGAIGVFEGFGSYGGTYTATEPPTTSFVSNGGIIANNFNNAYGNGDLDELTAGEDFSDPASQWGGIPWTGIGGSKTDWTPRCDKTYHAGTRRMVYSQHQTNPAESGYDFSTWRQYNNDPKKGRIYYLGGYNWRKNTASGFRILMNTVFVHAAGPSTAATGEVARSAPILAPINGSPTQFSGTFVSDFVANPATTFASLADAPTFEFPDVKGHMRAIDIAQLGASSDYATIDGGSALVFDAAIKVAAMSVNVSGSGCGISGSCRHIFTNLGATNTTKVPLTQGNQGQLAPYFGALPVAEQNLLIERIHAGASDGAGGFLPALGGIDRSTSAVIEASPIAGSTRPTIVYVGGTDGMLHAFCADATVAPCSGVGAGAELWAFMPRAELNKVATNTTRIDGSPKVADVFADFGSGTKEYRTVLTFQTGNANPSAVYALDITDPAAPSILWEHTTTGAGTTLAMAVIHREGIGLTNATFVHTNSGTATPGMEVMALDSATGDVIWSQSQSYPSPRDGANPPVPAQALPGGVTALSVLGADLADTILVPSLWGAVYSLEAHSGTIKNGGNPLFAFSQDFHPIGAPVSVYRDNTDQLLRAVVVTGGFTDSLSPSATSWAPDNVNQYAVSFPVDYVGSTLTEVDVAGDPSLGILIDFGAGNRAFSQAVIAGNEIFITTDSDDINSPSFGMSNSGRLWRASLSGGGASSITTSSGASSVDVSMTTGEVLVNGSDGIVKSKPAGFDPTQGSPVEPSAAAKAKRFLWLRSQ